MSDILINKVKQLLSDKAIDIFIGHGEGTGGRIRPIFVRTPEDAEQLIFNENCKQSWANYLLKPEVKAAGKIGMMATKHALRAMMQLASEFQIKDNEVLALYWDNNELKSSADFKEIEAYLASQNHDILPHEQEMIDKLNAMTTQERWDFWQKEYEKCIKCYACRSACPMCYCHHCAAEGNQPQWFPVASHQLGNMDWHLMRAMHLSGRCINCGACAKVCPMHIPLNLLTYNLITPIQQEFGAIAGMKHDATYALSTFKTEDKENFIL